MARRKAVMTPAKKSALQWIQANEPWLSQVHKDIWNFHEPAWREYRSAAYYVDLLRQQGFDALLPGSGRPAHLRARGVAGSQENAGPPRVFLLALGGTGWAQPSRRGHATQRSHPLRRK